MNTVKVTIPSTEDKWPEKWAPLTIRGLDMGTTPMLLGFLTEEDRDENNKYIRRPTHIVTKVPGHSWYYNQYHPMQYAGVSVAVFKIVDYRVDGTDWIFETEMPWDEEFQKSREKKGR